MSLKKLGKQTVSLICPPGVAAAACVVGKKEGDGPLRQYFDYISDDAYFGEKTWEKAESAMLQKCFALACNKAGINPASLDYLFAGDLLNQCTGSTFALRDSGIPIFGLYGACSTMGEGLSLAAMAIDGGFADSACAMTCSHFCSAEKQYRFPLGYGAQRTPTAQLTVTGAGAVVLKSDGPAPYITHITTGRIVDAGVTDANNMGAAMAPAAYETIKTHFEDTGRSPADYDAIFTGDLGSVGWKIVCDLFDHDGVDMGPMYMDCGRLIYDAKAQDAHAGGSGCGCSASVLCGHIFHEMLTGRWKRVLFVPTGALMSPTTSQQSESIPGICHAVCFDMDRGM